jgi:hypothetical protein
MEVNSGGADLKQFMRKHWQIFTGFIAGSILATIGIVYVFLWFVRNAQSVGLVPSSLGLWTLGNLISFILNLVFWEFVFIGIPVIIVGIIVWQWWRRVPYAEKRIMHFGKRRTGGSGGLSFFFFIIFCIKIYLDGNWNVPIATWTLNYVVDSVVFILLWTAIIVGIPAALAMFWWLRHELKRP